MLREAASPSSICWSRARRTWTCSILAATASLAAKSSSNVSRPGRSSSPGTRASTRRAARKRSFPRWWRASREAQATAPALLGVRGRAIPRGAAARALSARESGLRRHEAVRVRRHDRHLARRALRQAQGRHPGEPLRHALRPAADAGALSDLQPDAVRWRTRHGSRARDRAARERLRRMARLNVLIVILLLCISPLSQAQQRISRAEAEKIALARVPGGKTISGKLEKEKGRQIWSFDVSMPGSRNITEVWVDARTGEVVSTQIETPAEQAKEAAAEKKAKAKQRP